MGASGFPFSSRRSAPASLAETWKWSSAEKIVIFAGFHRSVKDHILVGHHGDLCFLSCFDLQLESGPRPPERGAVPGVESAAAAEAAAGALWLPEEQRSVVRRSRFSRSFRRLARRCRGRRRSHSRGLRRPLCRSPSQKAPRAKPASDQKQKDQGGGDDPGEPGLLRSHDRRAARPNWDGLAVTHGQGIFRHDAFLIEPEIAGHGPHESPVEDPAGKLVPLLVFDRLAGSAGQCAWRRKFRPE